MPNDRTTTTDIPSPTKANLFIEQNPLGAGRRASSPTARREGKRIVRLDSSSAARSRLRAAVAARAHVADERARRLLRGVEARALGPLALIATLLVSLLGLSTLAVALRAARSGQTTAGHPRAHAESPLGITLQQVARLEADASAAAAARKRALAEAARWRSRVLAADRHRTDPRSKHR